MRITSVFCDECNKEITKLFHYSAELTSTTGEKYDAEFCPDCAEKLFQISKAKA